MSMGGNGKAYVSQHYKWSTILNKYERLFGRLRGTGIREREGRRK
jgi:hypothetical protein